MQSVTAGSSISGPSSIDDLDEQFLTRLNLLENNIFSLNPFNKCILLAQIFRKPFPNNSTFSYDEIESFPQDATFFDLGCGNGKTLALVSLFNLFKRAIGIEINNLLYRVSLETTKKFSNNYRTPLDQTELEVCLGDATYMDWSFGDLIYIDATSFDDLMLERINRIADRMLAGSVLILAGSKLSNDKIFDLIGISQATFISGSTRKVFFYKRNTRGVWSDNEAIKNKLHEILDREI